MAKEQGLSLLDIAPRCEQVKIGEESVNVYGISAAGVFALFERFPDMQKWFAGGKPDLMKMVKEAPDAIAAIIAAGCGEPGNEGAEKNAGLLDLETQLDVIEAIGRMTFKNGFGPFVKRIVHIADLARSANYGRVPDTKSRPESNSSLQTATTQKPLGTTPPAK